MTSIIKQISVSIDTEFQNVEIAQSIGTRFHNVHVGTEHGVLDLVQAKIENARPRTLIYFS